MVAKLEPPSQKPTGLSLRANEPLRKRGGERRVGRERQRRQQRTHSFWRLLTNQLKAHKMRAWARAQPWRQAFLH